MTAPVPNPASPRRRSRPPILSILFLLLFPTWLISVAIYQRIQGLHPGGLPFPDQRAAFSLDMATLDGPRWKATNHLGKILVVNFFATWCGPCRDELPDLRKIAGDYSNDVEIAAVGFDSDADSPVGAVETLKRFAQSEHPPFPILIPPDHASHHTEMIPYTYLVDRHGRIAYFMLGRFEAPHLRALIDQLLHEP